MFGLDQSQGRRRILRRINLEHPMKQRLTRNLITAHLLLLGFPAAAAVKVSVYQVIPPTADVVGLKSISTSVSENQGALVNAALIAAIQNKDEGKVKKKAGLASAAQSIGLGGFDSLKQLPIYEAPVNILTLQPVIADGDIQISGTAIGSAEIFRAVKMSEAKNQECVQRRATMTFNIQIASKAGAVLGSFKDTQTIAPPNVGWCSDTEAKARESALDPNIFLDKMRDEGIAKIVRIVKPTWNEVVFLLEKDSSYGSAVEAIKKGSNVGQSTEQIQFAHQSDPANHPAAFSGAVMMEMYGDLEGAKAQYGKAGALEQTKDQATAVKRMEQRIVDADRLQAMGLNVRGKLPGGDGGRLMSIKTSPKKRLPLTADPGAGDKIAEVPGKVRVTIIEESGNFFKVKTPNGKTGWIDKSNLK
jgi:hypothetical protein